MEIKLLIQELKIHLIREKPLMVRSLMNNLFSVTRIEGGSIDLVKVWFAVPWGEESMKLYPGCRRLQELEDQVTGARSGDLQSYDDREENLEVALLEHFHGHVSPFHSVMVLSVDVPYMKLIDGQWIIGKFAWQREKGEVFSKLIYEPAFNAVELSPYAATALKHSSYRDYHFPEVDQRHHLTDCPMPLVKYVQFQPQTGRMKIKEAMNTYPSGTHVRSMACRCEYVLRLQDGNTFLVNIASRCKAHDYMERPYEWLGSDEQVELVHDRS